MFGSSPETTGITKLTTAVAIVFMITSLGLAILSKGAKSDVSSANISAPAAQSVPVNTETAPAETE
jgi:preprotein translocase subunit SecG